MRDWGYKVVQGRLIDFDNNDFSVADFLNIHEPSYQWCISCGSCSATCSAALFTDFSLRKVNLMVRRGEIKGLRKELAKCMMCGKCQLICPRGINTRNIIHNIKRALNGHTL